MPIESKAAPYPADTRAKGWRFELDHERIRQSDTWALAAPDVRPWLLMLWMVSWEQVPCGSFPAVDELIAARIGMSAKLFARHRTILLRGWWPADDGRLYHDTIAARALDMVQHRDKTAKRVADYKARVRDQRSSNALPHHEQHERNDTGTGTGTGMSASVPVGTGAEAPPDTADTIFALGLPLLTTTGVSDRNARSMLGLLRKTHGDAAVIGALQRCAAENPLQPVPWLQAALKSEGPAATSRPDRIAQANIAVVRRFSERTRP